MHPVVSFSIDIIVFQYFVHIYIYIYIYTRHKRVYTGWCILSHATAIPHMVHQRDAPVYYLHVILLIWNILTRTAEVMEHEQCRENV